MCSQHTDFLFILLLSQLYNSQAQQQQTIQINTGSRYFVLLLFKPDKKQVEFTSNPSVEDVINSLPVAFKGYKGEQVALQRWSKEYNDYVDVFQGEQFGNLSKILVKVVQKQETKRDETMLRKFLLEDYDNQVWPWSTEGSPCNVSMNINFHKVLDVQLSKGSLHLLVWFRLQWFDPRLSWDESEWSNISSMWFADDEFSAGELWTPKIELWNSERPIGFGLYPQQISVSSEGQVFWSRNGQFYVACDLQGMDSFPYDVSSCVLEFSSWVYDQSRVQIYPIDEGYAIGGSVTAGQSATSQYTMEDIIVEQYTYPPYKAGTQTEGWPVLLYKIVFARKNINYTFKIIIPQTVLTLVGFGAFWMPPSCGERISLTITIPVANAVYDVLVYEQLPETSEMVFASSFGVGCFLFSMVIVVESIIAVILWEKKDPYFAAPWKSIKKMYLDYRDQRDWVIVIKAMDEELAKLGIERNILRSRKVSRAYKLKKSYRDRNFNVFNFVNSSKLANYHQTKQVDAKNASYDLGTDYVINENVNSSSNPANFGTSEKVDSSSIGTNYDSNGNVMNTSFGTNSGTQTKINNLNDLNSQKPVEIQLHQINNKPQQFEPQKEHNQNENQQTKFQQPDFQMPSFDSKQNQDNNFWQSKKSLRFYYESPQQNLNEGIAGRVRFQSVQIDGQNGTQKRCSEISDSKSVSPFVGQKLKCSQRNTSNVQSQQSSSFEYKKQNSGNQDLSWLDDMSLADVNSPNQVRELLYKVINLHSEWKGRKYIKKAFDRLTKRHGVKSIENRVQILMDVDNLQSVCHLNVRNYREKAQAEYNEKWQMMSKAVDRVSQFTIFPAFILFIFIMFLQVFLDKDRQQQSPIFDHQN